MGFYAMRSETLSARALAVAEMMAYVMKVIRAIVAVQSCFVVAVSFAHLGWTRQWRNYM